MKLSVLKMDFHPDHECSCGNPAHMAVADTNPVNGGGYRYYDRICSQCALAFAKALLTNVRPERGVMKKELNKK